MTDTRLRYWNNPERIMYLDDIVIPSEYEFTFPNENEYEFTFLTFPNENTCMTSSDEIIAAFEKLKQAKSFDDLYP